MKDPSRGLVTQKKLLGKVSEELLSVLKARFEKHINRHPGLKWAAVEAGQEDR